MQIDVASHAPHGRKHGTTFAESWTSADGAMIVAVGAVLAGGDPIVVADLLRTGARALITSRGALRNALDGLDRVVQKHAREHRDDVLAAAIVLFACARGAGEIDVAQAGQLHAALIDGTGAQHALHGRAGALGTGIELPDPVEPVRLRRDDMLVAATVPLDPGWWADGRRTAEALLHRSGNADASAGTLQLG